MLSTRQAHHVLRLAERHGARVVFAGDTRQQQPVEAGPGLRLIRDAVGSVRVDRIRRQKPDLEDILVHVHSETPAAARFRGGLMSEDERARLVRRLRGDDGQAGRSHPGRSTVSEALRDGDAETGDQGVARAGAVSILATTRRGALTALVDEWDRYTTGSTRRRSSRGAGAHPRRGAGAVAPDALEKRFARVHTTEERCQTSSASRSW